MNVWPDWTASAEVGDDIDAVPKSRSPMRIAVELPACHQYLRRRPMAGPPASMTSS